MTVAVVGQCSRGKVERKETTSITLALLSATLAQSAAVDIMWHERRMERSPPSLNRLCIFQLFSQRLDRDTRCSSDARAGLEIRRTRLSLELSSRLWRGVCGMRHENQRRSLGDGLAEGVVKDQTVHAALSRRNIVRADSDLISLAVADPLDAAQANVVQLLHDGAGLVFGNRPSSLSSIVQVFIVTVGARRRFECGRRRGGHSRRESIFSPRVFEDAKVDAFLVRLHAPSDRVAFVDVHPAHNIALLLSALQLVYTFGPVRAPLYRVSTHSRMDLQVLHSGSFSVQTLVDSSRNIQIE
jgi:hypothetical protein